MTRLNRLRLTLAAAVLAWPSFGWSQSASLAELQARAAEGDVSAEMALGLAYHNGQGVLRDYRQAATHFIAAARAGDPAAQNMIGEYLVSGLGVARDIQSGLEWLQAAAQSGQPDHLFEFASALEQVTDDSDQLQIVAQAYLAAAEQGHLESLVSLAVMHQDGKGVEQDFEKARQYYEIAANQGHGRALNNLGLLFVRGNGVTQDYRRAAELFAAAAETGLKQALTNLGVMYENGFGVPQSDDEAARLYRLSGQGADQSQSTLSFVYDKRLAPVAEDDATLQSLLASARVGDSVAQFQAAWLSVQRAGSDFRFWKQAERLFRASATNGSPAAMVNLAVMYERGLAVPQDYAQAQSWLIVALFYGYSEADEMSAALAKKMSTQLQNEAQVMAKNLINAGRVID